MTLLRLYLDDGRTKNLSADELFGGTVFVASQPASSRPMTITEVRLLADSLSCPVRFSLEAFTQTEQEAGQWIVTVRDSKRGGQAFELEYFATEQFGERVRLPAVMSWDHEREEMTGC